MRSYLIFPSDNQRYIDKALKSKSDVLIFDLEDSVKKKNKNFARKNLNKNLKKISNKKIYVRVNTYNINVFNKDIEYTISKNLSGYLIPKCESAIILEKQIKTIKQKQKNKFKLILLIESALGIINLSKILNKKNLKYINGLMFGHEDFAADFIKYFNEDLNFYFNYKQQLLLYAKASNLIALDTPCLEFKSINKMKKYFQASFQMGFDGSLLVNPNQVKIANNNYKTSKRDKKKAEELINISNEQSNSIFIHKKEFIGPPIIKRAKKILLSSNAISTFQKKNT